MELTHTFTVPVDVATAWATFENIAEVAECFPGATVTSVDGDRFEGTCKVKLGPIALQYAGSGLFVERDEATRRLVLEAKGRDKRGNGTAGAHVTAGFIEVDPTSTRVEVATDLQITGKPAQFGRGVMQDVSDKLLGQFVDCLEARIGRPGGADSAAAPASAPASDGGGPGEASGEAPAEASAGTSDDTPGGTGAGAETETGSAATEEAAAVAAAVPRAEGFGRAPAAPAPAADAIDLGATVLPALVRAYGRRVAAALVVVLLLRWVVRRRR